jgi:beta-lactamase class A
MQWLQSKPDAMTDRRRDADVDDAALGTAAARFVGDTAGRVVHIEVLGQPTTRTRHGDDTGYPAASLSKLPLVAAALLAGADGTANLSTPVPSSSWGSTAYPSVLTALHSDLTVAEMAALSIVTSDNPAAQVVLDWLPAGAWERATAALGCTGMCPPAGFGDHHFDGMHHQHTTVDEQVAVVTAIATVDELAPLYRWMGSSLLNQRVSAMVAPPIRFHHKTGSLDGVLHDVGILDTGIHQTIIVALTHHQADPVATQSAMVDLGVAVTAALTA